MKFGDSVPPRGLACGLRTEYYQSGLSRSRPFAVDQEGEKMRHHSHAAVLVIVLNALCFVAAVPHVSVPGT